MTDLVRQCKNCEHPKPHNQWGRCSEEGCDCKIYEPADATVVVLRNPETLRPVAVPDEIVSEVDRVYKAWVLHRDGLSWAVIAAQENWPSAAAVATEVRNYIDEGRAVYRGFKGQELLALAFERLEALYSYAAKGAAAGKVAHIAVARQIIRDEVELLAHIKDPDGDDSNKGEIAGGRTLVIASDNYSTSLQQVSEQT